MVYISKMVSPPSHVQIVLTELVTRCDFGTYSSSMDCQMLNVEEVPEMFKEPYIYSGYRQVDKPWSYYFRSMFMLHNESMNVWTHCLGFFSVLYSFVVYLGDLNMQTDDHASCVIIFGVCCLANLALSATAHLFHSKSPWHHFAFLFLDYMGVSFVIFGSGVISMFVCSSKAFHDQFSSWFLPVEVFSSWLAFFACVYAKVTLTHNNSQRKAVLLAGVVSQAVIIALPTAWRLVECALQPACEIQHVSHLVLVFFMLIMCGVMFGCHMPESLWPGHFDILGHGHQWFHVTAVLTMMTQAWAINRDLRLDQRVKQLTQPGTGEILAYLALLVALESATVAYYLWSIPRTCTPSEAPCQSARYDETEEGDTDDLLFKRIHQVEVGKLHGKK
ncbi:hypothetical protein EGW08_022787, partial [Elysia chlorotica]